MQLKVNGNNFEITPAISDYAEKRFVKLKKYFEGLLEIHVHLIKEGHGNLFASEVTVFGDGVVLHSEDKQEDLYQAIDMVVEKLERQLKKYKDKLKVRKSKESFKTRYIKKVFEEDEEMMIGEDKVVFMPLDNKPMNSEEAILQLKNSKLHFLMFNNTDTGSINVIYKRKDGSFAIITS